jgi:flagellar biosynthesis chaperone FliJ
MMRRSLRLARLLDIRQAEERQSRNLMESVVLELRSLENISEDTHKRRKHARGLITTSLSTGDGLDRTAAIEEMAISERVATALQKKIEAIELQVERLRQDFLAKRIERRQVETLIDQAKAQEAIDSKRSTQIAMDDWYRAQHRSTSEKLER